MNCRENQELVCLHGAKDLPPDARDHLARCSACRAFAEACRAFTDSEVDAEPSAELDAAIIKLATRRAVVQAAPAGWTLIPRRWVAVAALLLVGLFVSFHYLTPVATPGPDGGPISAACSVVWDDESLTTAFLLAEAELDAASSILGGLTTSDTEGVDQGPQSLRDVLIDLETELLLEEDAIGPAPLGGAVTPVPHASESGRYS